MAAELSKVTEIPLNEFRKLILCKHIDEIYTELWDHQWKLNREQFDLLCGMHGTCHSSLRYLVSMKLLGADWIYENMMVEINKSPPSFSNPKNQYTYYAVELCTHDYISNALCFEILNACGWFMHQVVARHMIHDGLIDYHGYRELDLEGKIYYGSSLL